MLLVSIAVIRIIMTYTIKTTWGFHYYREGRAEQQGFHLFVQTERERDTLCLSSISSLRGRNQMDTLITLPMSEGANGALSAD